MVEGASSSSSSSTTTSPDDRLRHALDRSLQRALDRKRGGGASSAAPEAVVAAPGFRTYVPAPSAAAAAKIGEKNRARKGRDRRSAPEIARSTTSEGDRNRWDGSPGVDGPSLPEGKKMASLGGGGGADVVAAAEDEGVEEAGVDVSEFPSVVSARARPPSASAGTSAAPPPPPDSPAVAHGGAAIEAFVPDARRGGDAEAGAMGREESRLRRIIVSSAPLVEGRVVVDAPKKKDGGGKRRKKRLLLAGGAVVILAIIGVIMVILMAGRGGQEEENPIQWTPPSKRFLSLLALLIERGITPAEVLDDPSSPQNRAALWLADEDPLSIPLDTSFDHAVQRYRLVALYYSTGGAEGYWIENLKFLSEEHECNWNDGGDVYGLGVHCGFGVGSDPDEVDKLNFMANNLTGPMPAEMWTMGTLRNATFMQNGLTGVVPESIGELLHLEFICLGFNGFTGTVPEQVGELTKLTWIGMDANNLVGTVPSSVLQLSNLRNISMAWNSLTGTIPSMTKETNPNLRWVYFGNNNLAGPVPPSLPPFVSIVDLPGNRLNGTIPEGLANLENFKWLNLGRNELTGKVPEFLTGVTSLSRQLRLHQNKLTGTIPEEIGNLAKLVRLDLSGNSLNGTVPMGISGMEKLQILHLQDNELEGQIPESLEDLLELNSARFENNNLEGGVGSICGGGNKDIFERATPAQLVVDCLGEEPRVLCECCTECCDGSGTCRPNPQRS